MSAVRRLPLALVLTVGLAAAPADAVAKRVKVSAHFYYVSDDANNNCTWGIGIAFPKVAGASSYLVRYWDGYYGRVIESTVALGQLGTDPEQGKGTLLLGVTGGGYSPPCESGAGDPTGGGRFSKGAKAWALFGPGDKPPPPDGIDWRMPPRLNAQTWTSDEGLPRGQEVNEDEWKVNLFLTKNDNPAACLGDVKWEWKVDAPKGAKVVDKPKDGCSTSMSVSDLGSYKATATKYERRKGKFVKTSTQVSGKIVVKDWLLVGFGDSNGSGEGNPPFRFEQCNRTEASYQFQTAQYVESHDPRSSVTFVFAACSGAIIEDLYKTRYVGINPGRSLAPQLTQAARLIDKPLSPDNEKRQVDGAIISIGVNNLGFGPLLKFCIEHFNPERGCEGLKVVPVRNERGGVDSFTESEDPSARTLQTEIEALVTALPAKYGPLAKALSSKLDAGKGHLGVKPSHVMLTQYPDFTRGSDGALCETTIGPASTWGFVALEAAGLNGAVAQGAGANGWQVVNLDQGLFTGPPAGHGYCASDPYFVSVISAVARWNVAGAFHPNSFGHNLTSMATRPKLCQALYGNARCDGKPK